METQIAKSDFRIVKKGDKFFVQQKNIRKTYWNLVKTVWWGTPDRIILGSSFDSFESAETRLEIHIDEFNEELLLEQNKEYFYFE